MWAYVLALLVGAGGAAWGTWQVQEWRWTANTAAQREAEHQARESDARQQRRFADQAAGAHARTVATLNNRLGDARAQIALLSDRQCLDAGTVRMLNNIGASGLGVRAPAGQPAGAAAAAAGRGASERDTASHIALCRASYAAVSDQLNKILDIEDGRHKPAAQ
ncbi:hypothetical protein [Simplicispira sedimenti]|uniref:hypothetical protein n=1 Tax=Simplicispira sedimenti TaxID=2919500 RepID=UPI001FAB1FF5|nr:hypothetical protein [Acidovorax sp. W1-6]